MHCQQAFDKFYEKIYKEKQHQAVVQLGILKEFIKLTRMMLVEGVIVWKNPRSLLENKNYTKEFIPNKYKFIYCGHKEHESYNFKFKPFYKSAL